MRFFRGWIWLAALVVFLGIPVYAGQIIYTAWKSPRPLQMECDDYLQTPPDALWLDLQDCSLDYGELRRVYNKSHGVAANDDNYIPVIRKAGSTGPILLLLKVAPDEAAYLNGLPDNPTPAQMADIGKVLRPLMDHRRLRGVIQIGIDSDDKTRDAIQGSGLSLAQNWMVIEQKDPTSIWVAFVALLVPLGGGGFLLFRFLRRQKDAASATVAGLSGIQPGDKLAVHDPVIKPTDRLEP